VSITQDGNRNAKKNRKEVGAHISVVRHLVLPLDVDIHIPTDDIPPVLCVILSALLYSTEMMMKGKM
jgi:hypothetical protein